MSPNRSIHSSKKEAILQLCNFLCSSSVTNITELSNGEILLKTIQARFPEFANDYNVEDVKPECLDVIDIDSKEKNSANVKTIFDPASDDADLTNTNEDTELTSTSENAELTNSNENVKTIFYPANENTENNFRLNCIQKFIDDRYGIKSCEIISYPECLKNVEVEILKIAIFVLSEIVKHLLYSDQGHLQTLYHLDAKYQTELEEILKFFISERNKISKDKVEKLLYKASVKSGPFLTPKRNSPRQKYQKTQSPLTPKEDVFSNSPLKRYFESPIFKKEDILMKDRHIESLEKKIEEADEEITEKQCIISELEKDLKKRDLQIQKLKKNESKLKEDIKVLQNSCQSEFCIEEKEGLIKRIEHLEKANTDKAVEIFDLRVQTANLEEEKSKLEKALKEKEKFPCISFETSPSSTTEIEELRKTAKFFELKCISYRKQLGKRILTELKEKDPSGDSSNQNKTYENIWSILSEARNDYQENVKNIIEEDYRNSWEKVRKFEVENKMLREKIKILEEMPANKILLSIGTQTDVLLPEFKIPETEKLRNSSISHQKEDVEHLMFLSRETCNLDNSGSFIKGNQQHSVNLPNSEMCSEKPPEAVLWEVYHREPETENLDDINFSLGSFPENSHLDVTSSSVMKSDKENPESDVSLCQENKFIFGNLNFDVLLYCLKKLTKNGSFQKVLQVFEKLRNTKETSKSNSIDIQELLKIMTECLDIIATYNKSFPEVQDKGCSTDQNEEKVCDECKNFETEIEEKERKLEEFTKEKKELEYKLQAAKLENLQQDNKLQEVVARYKLEYYKFKNHIKDYGELKGNNAQLLKYNHVLMGKNEEVKKSLRNLTKQLQLSERSNKKLIEENKSLVQGVKKYREENKKLKEKESLKLASSTANLDSKEAFVEEPNYFSLKEFYNNSQNTANESTLSGAFHKNLSHYVSENEDDFVYYNSLETVKQTPESSRFEELRRRNSLLPIHLQSAYPVEACLKSKYESLYVRDDEKIKEESSCKKRKLDDQIIEEPSTSSRPSSGFQRYKIVRKFTNSTPKKLNAIVKRVYNTTPLSVKRKK